jgi:hypothetical protein
MFPMIFQSWTCLRKSKHDILSGSPKDIFAILIVINASIEMF